MEQATNKKIIKCPNCKFEGPEPYPLLRLACGIIGVIALIVGIVMFSSAKTTDDYLHLFFFRIPAVAVVIGICMSIAIKYSRCPQCGYKYVKRETAEYK
jgi:predicted RNA-binding Zn-ribbon protein involved in translation (DUF1610 family)